MEAEGLGAFPAQSIALLGLAPITITQRRESEAARHAIPLCAQRTSKLKFLGLTGPQNAEIARSYPSRECCMLSITFLVSPHAAWSVGAEWAHRD